MFEFEWCRWIIRNFSIVKFLNVETQHVSRMKRELADKLVHIETDISFTL